mmetsp:Transcript_7681/g.20382  ORF Transcript_7681/g.20382 Transcript_7681/m.20382 type:complete len:255 (-) Transcript_7681:955-1719(-)
MPRTPMTTSSSTQQRQQRSWKASLGPSSAETIASGLYESDMRPVVGGRNGFAFGSERPWPAGRSSASSGGRISTLSATAPRRLTRRRRTSLYVIATHCAVSSMSPRPTNSFSCFTKKAASWFESASATDGPAPPSFSFAFSSFFFSAASSGFVASSPGGASLVSSPSPPPPSSPSSPSPSPSSSSSSSYRTLTKPSIVSPSTIVPRNFFGPPFRAASTYCGPKAAAAASTATPGENAWARSGGGGGGAASAAGA